MTLPTTVQDVNSLGAKAFMATFGDVAEHSPWVAEAAEEMRPFANRDAIVAAFEAALRGASRAAKLDLIRAHPDLATRARAVADASRREQAGVGLDALTPDEYVRFNDLNAAYHARFGFPFIFAVRGADKGAILAAFADRLGNSPEVEFDRAVAEIVRIFRFRIEDRVSS